uniref:Ig-like domain-containing protein n=1 Tax=Panagrellus redivivus TaxID=6233 RepID=A0A7E4VDE8_PANRE
MDSFQETVGNSLILDCGHATDIQWRKDFEDISSADLHNVDSSAHPRRYIRAEGQFVIRKLTMNDAGFYSCLSTPRFLQRTFRVYISEINWTAEAIGYIQIGIRYFTGLLMMVLITRVILKTNTTSERQIRRGRASVTK